MPGKIVSYSAWRGVGFELLLGYTVTCCAGDSYVNLTYKLELSKRTEL